MTVAERRDEDANRAHPHFWPIGLIDGPTHSMKLVPLQMTSRIGVEKPMGFEKCFIKVKFYLISSNIDRRFNFGYHENKYQKLFMVSKQICPQQV